MFKGDSTQCPPPDFLTNKNKSMEKVIKQKEVDDITIEFAETFNGITAHQVSNDVLFIEKSKTREVALAICPELQSEIKKRLIDPVEFEEWKIKNEWEYKSEVNMWRNKKGIVIVESPTSPLYINTERLLQIYLNNKTKQYGRKENNGGN